MRWTQRIVNAVRGARAERPRPGRLILPRSADTQRDYPTAGLTPTRLLAILREMDDGAPASAMHLFEDMEEKDAHLFAVANTRRLALTGLAWQVVSAAETRTDVDRGRAEEAAAYCRSVLAGLDMFEEFAQHLALALGRNIAVGEIVWDAVGGRLQPVDLVPVDFARLVFDDLDGPRILTEDEPREGIALLPNKFVVHTPHSVSGHPQRGGLLRVTALMFLAKNLTLKDWLVFSEIFGMPVRVARYEPGATAEEKQEMLRMLETLGMHAAGIFSKAIELQFLQGGSYGSGPPYEHLVEFLNREISKAWLGQTLTTDTSGQRAALASTQIHEMVRKDVLADDIRKEGRTLRRDLLGPLTRMQFGPDAPVPYFTRQPGQFRSVDERIRVLAAAVNQLGLRIPQRWVHETLGLPQASAEEPALPGATR
ncbi:MAG TPA: DUF935 family protein [Phycisphaerae bacterium]|nr:DUF935 family protein [Phycisphaerae bacterium]HNU43789.1 DUF935 family protein [Phycisphaerae bacterium]